VNKTKAIESVEPFAALESSGMNGTKNTNINNTKTGTAIMATFIVY
jgi:hypothetical protein